MEAAIERNRRRNRRDEAVASAKKAKKNAKKPGKGKSKKKRKADDGSDDDADSDFVFDDMYKKPKKLPGQFENCELCDKRFTVTPYSKTGPDGGLVCTPCGKNMAKDAKAEGAAVKKQNPAVKRRRKVESERMDGIVRRGAKSLVEHSIETVLKHHDEIESFDNMPEHLILRICQLFTKHRVLNASTAPLFMRADMETVTIYDCACTYTHTLVLVPYTNIFRHDYR